MNPKFLIMIDSETLTLIIMWAIGVVAFFVLWAILAKVVQRISNRKHEDDTNSHDVDPTETMHKRDD